LNLTALPKPKPHAGKGKHLGNASPKAAIAAVSDFKLSPDHSANDGACKQSKNPNTKKYALSLPCEAYR
jgi:hypothetical protein